AYVANSGQLFSDSVRGRSGMSDVNREYPANGVFFDLSQNPNAFATSPPPLDGREDHPEIKMLSSMISDGLSNTLLLSESVHKLYWAYEPAESKLKTSPLRDDKRFFGFTWANQSDCPVEALRINGDLNYNYTDPVETMDQISDCLSYPSSRHPGIVLVAYCDGSVTRLPENIDSV